MGKRIYLTEIQLTEIVSNGAYLNQNDTTNEYRFGSIETTVNGQIGDYVDGTFKNGKPVTTDRISKQITKPRVRGLGRTVIPESNQDLTGKHRTMQLSKNAIDTLKKKVNNYKGNKNAPGFKRANNIIKNGRVSNDNGYRILNDFEHGKNGEFLDPSLKKEIRQKLNNAENISFNNRQSKMSRGENVIKSSPRTGFKGGAHISKGNNIIGITYEN